MNLLFVIFFLTSKSFVIDINFLLILKRADLRWNRSLEDLEQLTKLQDELLEAASM